MSSTQEPPRIRCLGGAVHANSSLKSTLQYQVVEVRSGNRIFYGVGQTADQARDQARIKIAAAQLLQGRFLDVLAGHAPCPNEPYQDTLPANFRHNTPHPFASSLRSEAFVAELKGGVRANINALVASSDRKTQKVRQFFLGRVLTNGQPNELFREMVGLFQPWVDFWEVKIKTMEVGKAEFSVRRVLGDKQVSGGIFMDKTTAASFPRNQFHLTFLDCEFKDKFATEFGFGVPLPLSEDEISSRTAEALDRVFRIALTWLRRILVDILIAFTNSGLYSTVEFSTDKADIIAKLAYEKFSYLKSLCESVPEWKNLEISPEFATIVLQTGKGFFVIALVCGDSESGFHTQRRQLLNRDNAGFLIKDYHPTVLVLRTLKCFFYDQLLAFYKGEGDPKSAPTIFTRGKYGSVILRPDHVFHLFTNRMPCGQGNAFSKAPSVDGSRLVLNIKDVRSQGFPFRDESICLRGLVPVTEDSIKATASDSKWDTGSVSLSCWDKLMKRSFLGLQGALLSQLACPVYLGNVIVADSTAHDLEVLSDFGVHPAVRKACSKLPSKPTLGYQPVFPALTMVSTTRSQQTDVDSRAKRFSICHYIDKNSDKVLFELLDPATGRQYNGAPSLLCKRALFLRFRTLFDSIPQENYPPSVTVDPSFRGSYLEYKARCMDYNAEKEYVKSVIKSAVSGSGPEWIPKNSFFEKFPCTVAQPPKYADFAEL